MKYILADLNLRLWDRAVRGEVLRSLPLATAYAFPRLDDVLGTTEAARRLAQYPFRLPETKTRRLLVSQAGFTISRVGGVRRIYRTVDGDGASVARVYLPADLPRPAPGASPAAQVSEIFEFVAAQVGGHIFVPAPGDVVTRPERHFFRGEGPALDPEHARKTRRVRAKRRDVAGLPAEPKVKQDRREARKRSAAAVDLDAIRRLMRQVPRQEQPAGTRDAQVQAFVQHAVSGKLFPVDATDDEVAIAAMGCHVTFANALSYQDTSNGRDDVSALRASAAWLRQIVVGEPVPGLAEHPAEATLLKKLAAGNPRQLLLDLVYACHSRYFPGGWVKAENFFVARWDSPMITKALPALARMLTSPWHAKEGLEGAATLQDVHLNYNRCGGYQFPRHPSDLRYAQGKTADTRPVAAPPPPPAPAPPPPPPTAAELAAKAEAEAEVARQKVEDRKVELLSKRAENFGGGRIDYATHMAATLAAIDSATTFEAFAEAMRLDQFPVKDWGTSQGTWTVTLWSQLMEVRFIDDELTRLGVDVSDLPSVGLHMRTTFMRLLEEHPEQGKIAIQWCNDYRHKRPGPFQPQWCFSKDHPRIAERLAASATEIQPPVVADGAEQVAP